MSAETCEVAVPVLLHDTFTYRIPPEMRGQVCAGGRVIVPFGARKLIGVVTALPGKPPGNFKLKNVSEAIDPEPLLSPALLKLAGWVSEYYSAPIGEVFRSFLPLHQEFAQSEKAHVTKLGLARLEELEASAKRTKGEQADCEALVLFRRYRERTVRGFLQKVGGDRKMLARLQRQGWIEIVRDVRRRKPRAKEVVAQGLSGDWLSAGPVEPTEEQAAALGEIHNFLRAGKFSTALLHGVTGSGKTEVYARAIQACLEAGKTALLMVPEIALTPAVAEQFVQRFSGQVAVLHSGLTPQERSQEWWRLRRGEARIAVGTRSAVFAPVENLGLIIVDEEQDASYKQGETPRYHGRDTAVVRAKFEGAVVLLGSATPALETTYQVRRGSYHLLTMPSRVANRELAPVTVVDMGAEFKETGKSEILSRALVSGLQETLAGGGQALVLRNRRGYSNFLLCRKCGVPVQCVNCSISLTYHRRRNRLVCHYCGYSRGVPKRCEQCGSEHLYFVGEGTEKVEEAVQEAVPGARVARLDRDTAGGRRQGEAILRKFVRGEVDVLVGTQMIAKGHDFQGVTLVGVISADALLGLPDFRAAERTFQLLTQVAGRAGRGELPGKVLVQSYHTDHYAVQLGAAQDYNGFYEKEMHFRRLMHYPPFVALTNVVVRDRKLDAAIRVSKMLQSFFAGKKTSNLRALGPAPAPIARLKGDYRFHFLLKSPDRRAMQKLLRELAAYTGQERIPAGTVLVDVDPLSLI